MPYVYSTGTNDTAYVDHKPDPDKNRGYSEIIRQVIIKGGHGRATKHLVTPKGVVTKVTEDELEFLLKNDSFQRHMKNGFISYENKKVEPEKKAADMAQADGSAPLTPKDFTESENSTPENRIYKGKPKKT